MRQTSPLVRLKYDTSLTDLLDQLPHTLLAGWARACVERVLPLYETAEPGDMRPRAALEAIGKWQRAELKMWDARKAAFPAHAAARETDDPAACAAARATGQALGTIHVRGHATAAAGYALIAVRESGGDISGEEAWQREHLAELVAQAARDV